MERLKYIPISIALCTALWMTACRQRPAAPLPATEETVSMAPSAQATNHLINETSPYLQQHAHNPVNWYPWGEEALAKAKNENKPIFLSIGYSACHWCHVMERESFEDEATAAILNEHFISIKVDREERPDIDSLYMMAVQMLTGRGGWPLNVFLTPDLLPFFGGTYFPPEGRQGFPGFKTVLGHLAEAWENQPADVIKDAHRLTDLIKAKVALKNIPESGDQDPSDQAVAALKADFDSTAGGFSRAPKFPPAHALALLLQEHYRTGAQELLDMVMLTLDRMARGGIYDHVGGGFHRYSVDGRWLVPHFEKMLYDNAQLAIAYLEGYQVTDRRTYARIAEQTLDYVLRELMRPEGGFYSSQDADSGGQEGMFYIWTADQIKEVLGAADAAVFARHYNIEPDGNFTSHETYHRGMNIPYLSADLEAADEAELSPLRARLLEIRAGRTAPARDDKIIAAWNGLMISAMARGYQILGHDRYRQAAENAVHFIMRHMVNEGRLMRTGQSRIPGFLDDYALLGNGLIDLYEATFDRKYLRLASEMAQTMLGVFEDPEGGGLFYADPQREDLIAREKPFLDNVLPSGNAAAVRLLQRLTWFTGSDTYRLPADRILALAMPLMAAAPRAMPAMVIGAMNARQAPIELALIAAPDDSAAAVLIETIHKRFLPTRIIMRAAPENLGAESISALLPLLADKKQEGGRATAYVCRDFTCLPPVTGPDELDALLEGKDKP